MEKIERDKKGRFIKGWIGWLNQEFSERTREKMRKSHKGKKPSLGKHWKKLNGKCQNKVYVSWLKNKRNRVIKRLKEEGKSHTFGEWELLKKQYDYTCPCCGEREPFENQRYKYLTEDHIISLSKGGSDIIENIQPLCQSCNCKKHTVIIIY